LPAGETNDELRYIPAFSLTSGRDQAIGDAGVVFRGDFGRHLGPDDAGPDLEDRDTRESQPHGERLRLHVFGGKLMRIVASAIEDKLEANVAFWHIPEVRSVGWNGRFWVQSGLSQGVDEFLNR
jgi:hypothetical protein